MLYNLEFILPSEHKLCPLCLQKISPNLSKLVNYIEAVHFPGFDVEGKFYQMSSFGEGKAFKYFEDPEIAKELALLKYIISTYNNIKFKARQICQPFLGHQ